MDTTENKTEQYTVIEKKGKDLEVDDIVWYAQEWKKLSKTDRNGYSVLQGMLALEYPKDIFLVRLPSPPMEVKDAEALKQEFFKEFSYQAKGQKNNPNKL